MDQERYTLRFRTGIVLCVVGVAMLCYGLGVWQGTMIPQQVLSWQSCLWLGTATVVLGGFCILAEVRKRKWLQRLIAEESFVWAEVTGHDSTWLVNGVSYCCFRARGCDENGMEHEFLSDAVKTIKIQDKIGCRVKVYLDNRNPDYYYVDADSIVQ